MLNWLAKLLLTSTAIAPVLLSYAWVAYRAGEARQALVLVVLVVALVVISLGVLHYAKTQLERISFTATSVNAADPGVTWHVAMRPSKRKTLKTAGSPWVK